MTNNINDVIVQKFKESKFQLIDPIPLDDGIKNFILELSSSEHIITTNSCEGHDEELYHPYLAFLTDEYGWDCFWRLIMPELSALMAIHVCIINEQEKKAIVIRCHYEHKTIFWDKVTQLFIGAFCI